MVSLVHNGYRVDFYDSVEQAEAEIEVRMLKYEHLTPELRIQADGKYENRFGENLDYTTKVYFYDTLYSEMFLIIRGRI